MKGECPNCGASYQIDDSKIPEKGAHARCPKCKTRFFIAKEVELEVEALKAEKSAMHKKVPTFWVVTVFLSLIVGFLLVTKLPNVLNKLGPVTVETKAPAQKRPAEKEGLERRKIAAVKEKKQQKHFGNTIEEHYQKLVSLYNEKKIEEASQELHLFKKYNKLNYKDVDTINKKITIHKLEKEVKVIPASRVSDNLRIYEQLLKLDPDNARYKRKVALYRKRFEKKKREERLYRIVKSEDLSIKALTKPLSAYSSAELRSLPMNIRKQYKILVPSDISKEELKASMKHLVKQAITKNPDIDEIVVFAYDREEDSEGAYTFGKMEWCPNGNWAGVTPHIASSNDRSSYEYVFDIKRKVGSLPADDIPTKQEFAIYDAYYEALWANPDLDEKIITKRVAKKLGISEKKLTEIWLKVETYKLK